MGQAEKLQTPTENKLGTLPIGKLLVAVSLPIVISMLVQALYNVVDSIFVARLSEDALAAVSLAFPIQNLMIAVGVGTSVGVNSLVARRLGEKNFEAANRAATNGVFLAFLSWLAFVIVGIFFSDLYFASYASDPNVGPEIAKMGADYMRIVTIASFGMFLAIMYERLLQSTGRSIPSMVSQMTGAIVNIILDPIMIFGLLGFPKLGVAGAAIATVIGQVVGMAIAMWTNHYMNKDLKVSFRGFRPHAISIKHIYQVGLPSIIMQSIGSIMTFGMNWILKGFGSTAVAFFGAYFKLQSFAFMPVIGFNNGLVPIVGYNYGARKPDRIARAFRLTFIICLFIMIGCAILFFAIPGPLLSLFGAQESLMAMGVTAMRVISFHFPLSAFVIVCVGFFQAVGSGVESLIISVVRQLVFLLPAAFILSRLGGLDAVWWCFLIAEGAALIMAIFMFRSGWRKKIGPIKRELAAKPSES